MIKKYHTNKPSREILDEEHIKEILKKEKYTTLSIHGEKYPYTVSMNYGYDEEKHALIVHWGKKGLKNKFVKLNPFVSGTIIEDNGYCEGMCDHKYRSLVFVGELVEMKSDKEKKAGFITTIEQLEPEPEKVISRFMGKNLRYDSIEMYYLYIHEITGRTSRKK